MERKLTGLAVVFLLLATGGMTSVSAAPADFPEMNTQMKQGQAAQMRGGLPAPKGRLKFKSSGPVCMCAEGMSERDIERAMAKLKQAETSDSGTDNSQVSGEK